MIDVFTSFFDKISRLTFLAAELGIQMTPGQNPATAPTSAGTAGQATANVASPMYAPASEPGFFESQWMLLLFWGVVIVGMYFLMFRPQRKREKQMREMQSAIKTGDNVVTSGGLFGKVADVGTDCFVVELGISGRSVRIPVLKSDVLGVREPVMTPPPKEAEGK